MKLPPNSTDREALVQRLDSYWKLELLNVGLVPVAIIGSGFFFGARPGWLTLFALIPTCGLLAAGGSYWRAKLLRITGRPDTMRVVLPHLDRWQFPLLVLTVAALIAVTAGWVTTDLSAGLADRVMATVAAVLAALEYVNYYHRQLQHFDHRPDFQRLLAGRGFRRSQMGVDLARYRRDRTHTRREGSLRPDATDRPR